MFSAALVVINDDALVHLEALEQKVGLEVGVAVVGAPAPRSAWPAASRPRPAGVIDVELLGRRERSVQVFLRLPDVLVDDRREVDLVEVHAELGGEDFGGEGLARAARAAQERFHTLSRLGAKGLAQNVREALPVPAAGIDLVQPRGDDRTHDEIIPPGSRIEAYREGIERIPPDLPNRRSNLLRSDSVSA